MAITNPWSITYGSRQVGGSTAYQIHGPYVIDKSFDRLRLVFDIVISGSSFSNLQSLSDDLETDFRKRDQNLIIDLSGSTWTYTFGEQILNTTAALSKSGNADTDKGFSRAYTCIVEGDLPADGTGDDGLRDLEVNVTYEAGRQRTVTMRGTYTASTGVTAVGQYEAQFDTEAGTLLTAIDGSAVFELVAENYNQDRNVHLCTFTRQYLELLANQSTASLDDTEIRDHRVRFTDLSSHPGDSEEGVHRLRRVVGSYDCAIDIDQTTDLYSVFENKVKPHVRELFQTNFNPKVFALEDKRVSYDETTKRLSASLQFIYQGADGGGVVEVSQSMAIRQTRTIDYTPIHNGNEFAAHADPGWATKERVWSRTVIALGESFPPFGPRFADGVVASGWNVVQSTQQTSAQWLGDPTEAQIEVKVLTESIVERYNEEPGGTISSTPDDDIDNPPGSSGGGATPGGGSGGGGSGGSSSPGPGRVDPKTGPGRPLGNFGGSGIRY